MLLLDAPKDRPHPGYAALATVARRCRPFAQRIWCAGGLTPENLSAALHGVEYDGVDVARGVERCPGVKDHAALQRFITTARQRSSIR